MVERTKRQVLKPEAIPISVPVPTATLKPMGKEAGIFKIPPNPYPTQLSTRKTVFPRPRKKNDFCEVASGSLSLILALLCKIAGCNARVLLVTTRWA